MNFPTKAALAAAMVIAPMGMPEAFCRQESAPPQAAKEPWREEIEKKLSSAIDVTFEETPLSEIVNFVRDISGLNIIQEGQTPEVLKFRTSLKCTNFPLRTFLTIICWNSGLDWQIDWEAIRIIAGKPVSDMDWRQVVKPGDSPDEKGRALKTAEKLKSQKVTIDFSEAPLKDVLQYMQEISGGINFIRLGPYKTETDINLSMKCSDMSLENTLNFICTSSGYEWKIGQGGAAYFFEKKAEAPAKPKKAPPGEQGSLVSRRLPKELPEGLTVEKIRELILKVSPKAKVDYDEGLRLLLVVSDEPVELRRADELLNTLKIREETK